MLQKIECLVARFLILKYLPTSWILQAWHKLTGYRTYAFFALWLVVYELHRQHVGFLADDTLSKNLLDGLAGAGAATLLEKFKVYLPQLNSVSDALVDKATKGRDPQ